MRLARLYYTLKPLIPFSFRLVLRRWLAARKLVHVGHIWPIRPGSEMPPPGWQGWPENKQFALVLTHDVESPRGLGRVRELAALERAMGFRSSFNFIPEGPYSVPPELRQWLVSGGFEVGVHDHRHDGKLFRSERRFKASAERINHYLRDWQAVGFRSGFMMRNLEWIQQLGILYDASTFDTDPFEPQPQGMNTIFPFWVKGEDGPGYVELPYTLPQDSTLFNLLREPSIDIWKMKLDWIAAHGGMALVNVHPDYLSFDARNRGPDEYPVGLYEEFLGWVKEKYASRCWQVPARDVALFCRQTASLFKGQASVDEARRSGRTEPLNQFRNFLI